MCEVVTMLCVRVFVETVIAVFCSFRARRGIVKQVGTVKGRIPPAWKGEGR